jgi:putative two-component system protein, hydrogenase maturation factor HypX/HoxX
VTARLTSAPFTPLGAHQAVRVGLLDAVFGTSLSRLHDRTRAPAERLARAPGVPRRLEEKRCRREQDERVKPLEDYRRQE